MLYRVENRAATLLSDGLIDYELTLGCLAPYLVEYCNSTLECVFDDI